MDKIILNDGTNLEFSRGLGLIDIKIENKKFEELEPLLTTENLSNVQFVTSDGLVNGKYTNLKAISITKYLIDKSASITLRETSATS